MRDFRLGIFGDFLDFLDLLDLRYFLDLIDFCDILDDVDRRFLDADRRRLVVEEVRDPSSLIRLIVCSVFENVAGSSVTEAMSSSRLLIGIVSPRFRSSESIGAGRGVAPAAISCKIRPSVRSRWPV